MSRDGWRDPQPGDRYLDSFGDVFLVEHVVRELAYGRWEFRHRAHDRLRFTTLNGDGFTLLRDDRSLRDRWRLLRVRLSNL